jgi:protein-S-isoprenylcysteine O-methyltransferase Ste14
MSAVQALQFRRWALKRPTAARIGDWGLFAIWAGQATLTMIHAIRLGTNGDVVAEIHIAVVAVILWLTAFLFLLRGPAKKRDDGFPAIAVAFTGTWSMIALTALPLTWQPDWLLTATTLGLIAVYGWMGWALLTLRRNLSIFAEARQLVRHGPYGIVRHPLYFAHIVCYLLIGLPRLSVWSVLIVAIGISSELLRARNEERLLRSVFPEYASYAATTPRFVPRSKHARAAAISSSATASAAKA